METKPFWKRLFGSGEKSSLEPTEIPHQLSLPNTVVSEQRIEEIVIEAFKQVLPPAFPTGGSAESSTGYQTSLLYFSQVTNLIEPEFNRLSIPILRKLSHVNPDISQAVDTLVKLGNTGYKIKFDPRVSEDMVDKMRIHIENKLLELCRDYGGVSQFMNRLYRQIYVAGALAGEWVPMNNLRGLKKVVLIRPEKVYWAYDERKKEWVPYQKLEKNMGNGSLDSDLKKLNKNTFRYQGLMGDDDLPYGIPPMLAALDPLDTQKDMITNLKAIVKQMGVIGFMQALLDKEDKKTNETEAQYKSRMEALLQETSKRLTMGLKDGISVGFKDDVEFEFHAPTKATSGAAELFIQNELMVMSGMKIDSSMLGRNYATSEGQITVVFNKLLSELKNVQNCVREFLEYGFKLELIMAGYKFETLKVEFNTSTLNDDLKYQQAKEIKIRNLIALYNQGILNNDSVADELGYEKPDIKEPRVMTDPASTAQKAQKREASKDASDRANRRKNRPGEKSQKEKGTKSNS
jgi:hypothetical protein